MGLSLDSYNPSARVLSLCFRHFYHGHHGPRSWSSVVSRYFRHPFFSYPLPSTGTTSNSPGCMDLFCNPLRLMIHSLGFRTSTFGSNLLAMPSMVSPWCTTYVVVRVTTNRPSHQAISTRATKKSRIHNRVARAPRIGCSSLGLDGFKAALGRYAMSRTVLDIRTHHAKYHDGNINHFDLFLAGADRKGVVHAVFILR